MRIMFMARFCKTLKMVLRWFSPCHGVQKGCWKSTTSEATSLLRRFRNPASPASFRQFQGSSPASYTGGFRRILPQGFSGVKFLTTFEMRRIFPPVNFRSITTVPWFKWGPLEMAENIWASRGFFVHISGSYKPHLWLVVGQAHFVLTCPHFRHFLGN